MVLAFWRFIVLLLAALSLTMESAHVLELPQKIEYSPQLYAAVNGSMYRYFAIVGGFYQIVSIVLAVVLAYLVRKRRPSFRWTLAGAVLLAAAFGIWMAAVQPVNLEIGRTVPAAIPNAWMNLRYRWEYGHAAGFLVQLLGFSALLVSVLVETPQRVISGD